MGMWSVPWANEEKAKIFAEQMSKPWMAEVVEEDGEFYAELEDIGGMFWEEEVLIGSDQLCDLLSDKAEEEQTNFDIRDMVKESLQDPLERMEMQPRNPKNLEAVNIVRKALGLEELSENRKWEDFQKCALEIIEKVKSHDVGPLKYILKKYSAEMKEAFRTMMGVPEGFERRDVYCLVVKTKEEKEFELSFEGIEAVKGFSYQRPGLLHVYYV